MIETEVIKKGLFKRKTWWVYVRCDKCNGFIVSCNATKDPFMKMKKMGMVLCEDCLILIHVNEEAITKKGFE